MKKCQRCLSENDDLMNFCWECGAPLPASFSPGAKTELFTGTPTAFRGNVETETFVNNRFEVNPGIQTPQPPRKSKTGLFLGLAAVVIILGVGIFGFALFAFFALYQNNQVVSEPKPIVTNSPIPLAKSPTPTVTFTPPTEPTKQGSFTVQASQGWQLSDIDVVPLEEFRTKVEGQIDISGIKTGVSSSGVNDAKTISRRIYPDFPTGALLMRTRYADGKFSNVVAISANGANGNWQNYPDERGKIEFCVNDNAPENNGGHFTVTVTLVRAPKATR